MATVLLHGAGSSGVAAALLLGRVLTDLHTSDHPASTCQILAIEDRLGDTAATIAALDAIVEPGDLVVGISLGAHAAARWASTYGPHQVDLLLMLPAWLGDPVSTPQTSPPTPAPSTDVTATQPPLTAGDRRIEHLVARGREVYGDGQYAEALARAACQPGPSVNELKAIGQRCAVVGWPGDPIHPQQVAERWASLIPHATLHLAHLRDPCELREAATEATRSISQRQEPAAKSAR